MQKDLIDLTSSIKNFSSNSDGSQLIFVGQARDRSNNKEVLHLEYEIYKEMALSELNKIADDAISNWSLTNCLIIHRYGKVDIKEASILIIVSSPHRKESYLASKYIIDTIKKTVPIWKKEFYSDGSVWKTDRS
jgi:molybdopterin synthase catalytic subunit